MEQAARAFVLAYRERSLRPYIWRPLLLAIGAYLALLVAGFLVLVPWLAGLAESKGLPAGVGWAGGSALLGVAWFFLSGPLFLILANLFSAFLWEGLSRKVEEKLYGTAEGQSPSLAKTLQDILWRLPVSIFATILVLLLGPACFGIFAVLLAGWMGLNDYTAPAFARRGIVFPRQAGRALQCPGAPVFLLLTGVAALVPFLNILLVPGWVAAGTAMCRESQRPKQA